MDTMKRRVIYMSDTEWGALRELAKMRGQTISAVIRKEAGLLPRDGWNETPAEKASHDFGDVVADAENAIHDFGDKIRFNSQPFKGPIPKKR